MIEHSKPRITKPEANQTATPDGSSGGNARRDTTRQPRRRTPLGSHRTSDNPRNTGASRKDRAIWPLLQHGNREKAARVSLSVPDVALDGLSSPALPTLSRLATAKSTWTA